MAERALPLAGVRILEFGTGYVGPVCAKHLADFGADVVKVETHRRLDFLRGVALDQAETRPSFFDTNRNKRSILVDATTPQGHALLLRLAARTDVVVENLGGGTIKRLGLDYATLCAVRPDLVWISLQGLGATAANSVTLGQNLPPLIGLTHLWNHPGAPRPVGSQLFHPDYFAGVHAACLVMAMLDHRRRTGQGHSMDASQAEAAASLLGPFYLDWTINRRVSRPQGNRAHPGAPLGCYRCAGEDAWCAIAVRTDEEWRAFRSALGDPAWAYQERFAGLDGRLRHRDELDALVEAWTRERAPREVMELLQAHGVPAGAVHTARDVVEDPQLRARGFIVALEHERMGRVEQGGIPVRLSDTPGALRSPAPLLGQHTVEVLREWLGLEDEELGRLEQEGALW